MLKKAGTEQKHMELEMQSLDILRLVIPQISKHKQAKNPINYTIWYEYYRSKNIPLKRAINEYIEQEKNITDKLFETFFDAYITDQDTKAFKQVQIELIHFISLLSETAPTTDTNTSTFQRSLQNHENQLNSPAISHNPLGIIGKLITETQTTLSSLQSMRQQMNESHTQINELKNKLNQATAETLIDALTGIANRKGLLKAFEHVLIQPKKTSTSISLLMLDIDHFKKVNDTHGHVAGDKVIKFISDTLVTQIKGQDTASRYGGEEFVVLLPNTTLNNAQIIAESIRIKVEKTSFILPNNQLPLGQITISIGVTHYLQNESIESFISRADTALYESKKNGRNRITTYNQERQPTGIFPEIR